MSTNSNAACLLSELDQNGIFWSNVQSELQKGNFTAHDKRYDWILDQHRFASIKELSTPAMKDTILCLGPGRHDVQLDEEEGLWQDKELIYSSTGLLKELVETALRGKMHETILYRIGALPTEGGERYGNGIWHRDVIPLFQEELDITLPPYYLTVLIPLDRVSFDDGPTEFLLGSHHCTWEKAKQQWNSGVYELDAGDIVLFDGRIAHRGTTNISAKTRTVFYLVFYCHWLNESRDIADAMPVKGETLTL